MSSSILSQAPVPPGTVRTRRTLRTDRVRHGGAARIARRGAAGLLALGVSLVAAACVLGVRTWHVGTGLGSALFPVEGIVELAAVAAGTVAAGWAGGHTLVALAWVLACRRGVHWAAGERAVAEHAPAVVRRLARAAVGAGIGLALAAPTATAVPERGALASAAADGGPAVVLDLGWRPTGATAGDGTAARSGATEHQEPARRGATHGRASGSPHTTPPTASPHPVPERSSLVDRGLGIGGERRPVVVVEPGDTLWSIAAARLTDEATAADRDPGTDPTAGATAGEIAAAVQRWHQANRQTIGADPDLIRPGTVLRVP
ncbi:LysM peptidoglycan-binding domain-containing protein [Promicromonospora sp. MS192]|uniref:LysM peptidoglycan-binding domain-containing protein n=1 Tax=Promicromonospora sp. MS192 TaxID=3412684 RepID=UPI003C2E05DF